MAIRKTEILDIIKEFVLKQFSLSLSKEDIERIEGLRMRLNQRLGIRLSRNAAIRRLLFVALNAPEVVSEWACDHGDSQKILKGEI